MRSQKALLRAAGNRARRAQPCFSHDTRCHVQQKTLLAILGIATLSASPLHAKAAPKAPVPLEEYFKIRRVGSRSGILLSFSHDEQLVAYLSDEGGRTDV